MILSFLFFFKWCYGCWFWEFDPFCCSKVDGNKWVLRFTIARSISTFQLVKVICFFTDSKFGGLILFVLWWSWWWSMNVCCFDFGRFTSELLFKIYALERFRVSFWKNLVCRSKTVIWCLWLFRNLYNVVWFTSECYSFCYILFSKLLEWRCSFFGEVVLCLWMPRYMAATRSCQAIYVFVVQEF